MKITILFTIIFTFGFLRNVLSRDTPLPFEAIFNFGDSISDTGNSASHDPFPRNSPYGSTFFKSPAGRLSNGRLMIDFIAGAYGLPMLPAYLTIKKGTNIKKGVNFAYSGSTALNKTYFDQRGMNVKAAAYSLGTQLDWFNEIKPSLCKSKAECDAYFKKSLFLVGEIGGNDLNEIIPNKNITAIKEMIPDIVDSITKYTSKVIEHGAVEIAVPGNFPIGCNSFVLKTAGSDKKEDYDEYGCLIPYNNIISEFNEQLKKGLETLRQKNPTVKIMYFDYYGAALSLFHEPKKFGFVYGKIKTFEVCCGKGGGYKLEGICGRGDTTVCADPSKHINWDGFHLTEAAYKLMAKGLLEGPYANPPVTPPPFKIH
ncbi:GDSL esterase/lipase At5g45910-like [Vigna unguiculata]|uniref:GDSL esterase/lipase At5g45910-like n=1 Tax=Vigna unguiculata TaxID=3917 RepID=UPI001016EC2C|nr:GDSL esterase/lipase At5g45910-like [Vigna unguiculata]